MNTERPCQHCGKPLEADAIEGLCPECLMRVGLGFGTEATGAGLKSHHAFVPPTPAELAPGFPQFEILAFVGQGGMGAVYKARQKQLERIVALKILPPGTGEEPAFAERFAREAKSMARLNHPGIVTIYDFGLIQSSAGLASEPRTDVATGETARPLYYFIMEFVDGVSLRQLMQAGRISPHEALAIVPQICDALQYAHDQGIVHRDIKPENILLDRQGRVKVADFGLAKLVEPEAPRRAAFSPSDGEKAASEPGDGRTSVLTDAGKVMGTPHYMAPEQVEDPAHVDHRADIYALGVVFYQMLTGELPSRLLEAPSSKVQIDVRLDRVVLRALESEPDRRYQQVSEVRTAVETIVQDSTLEPNWSKPRTHRRASAQPTRGVLVGACLMLLTLCLIGCLHYRASHPAAVDLLQRYPTGLTAGDAEADHARSWQFTEADLFHVSHFSLQVSNDLRLELGPADLGIGHCADGALWALLIPRQDGTLTRKGASRTEPVLHVWLRFHPKEIARLFPPSTVSLGGTTNRVANLLFIATLKLNPRLGSSFLAFPQGYDGPIKLLIPKPRDMSVDVDLSDGSRQLFMVDTETQTARLEFGYSKTAATSATNESASEYMARQLREAQEGNYWSKYRLWQAFDKGDHGVEKDPAQAQHWLEELVKGVSLVRFLPANGFEPATPMEFMNKLQAFSPLFSDPERIGIAGFFRTKNQDGKLAGSFLSNEPERLKAAFEKNPYLKVLSVEPLTPALFIDYERSTQESLPGAAGKSGPDSRISTSPKHFWFDYQGPQSPGKRYWTAVDQIWVEQYESGESSRFKVVERTTVEGTSGTVVAKISGASDKTLTENDGTFQAFIPDIGSQKMLFWFRFNTNGEWQPWQSLGEMQGVE
jgi:serine/threonine protein kinase